MTNSLKKIIATVVLMASVMPMSAIAADTMADLQAQIDDLMAQIATLKDLIADVDDVDVDEAPDAVAVEGCSVSSFDRSLKKGMSGDDVKCLQIVLNTDSDTQVSSSGAGSPGGETKYFGGLTYAAVVKFQEKYADDVLAIYGLTSGTGFVGKTTKAKLNELLVAEPADEPADGDGDEPADEPSDGDEPADDEPVITGDGMTVALAADTPVGGTIVATASAQEMARYVFTNGDAEDVKVTQLRVKRTGISNDATLSSVYVFDGYKRLGDEATLSSGYATFNASAGIFTVPAGGSITISIRADILTGTSGQTARLGIESASDLTTDASAMSGTFPMNGNLMSVATASSSAAVTMGTATPAATNINATTDFIAWSDTLNVTNQDVTLEYVRFGQIGSISVSSLSNIRLVLGGVEIATGELVVANVGQDLVFDLSASPIAMTKGQTKTMQVYVDIVSGANKTLRIGLEKKADIFIKDAAYGSYVTVSGTAPFRAGAQSIQTGTVTITRSTESASGNVVNASTNVSLGKFDIKANGEEVKINSLNVGIIAVDTDSSATVYYLRSVTLLLDGVQVGNTTTVLTNSQGVGYSTFNIYQKIAAGTTKVLEVRGDLYGCALVACSANILSATDTVQVKVFADTDNAQGMSSLDMIDAPGGLVLGNALTVGEGTLTVSVNPSYGNQTVAEGSNTKIASYVLTAAAYDKINISSMLVTLTLGGSPVMAITDLTNMYLDYGGTTTIPRGTVALTNTFSLTTSMAPSETLTVDVYASIGTSSAAGNTVTSTLTVTATKNTDGSGANPGASLSAQTIQIAAGTITTAAASSTPSSAIVVGGSTGVELAKFNFAALYEAFTVSEIRIKTATGTANEFQGEAVYLVYKNEAGETVTSTAQGFNATSLEATFTGQTMALTSGVSSVLTVYGNMNVITAGTAYGNAGAKPKLTLVYYRASSGSQSSWIGDLTGSEEEDLSGGIAGEEMVVYKTKPTVELKSGITTGTLTNGTVILHAATISADAGGDVGLKKLTYNFIASAGIVVTGGNFQFYRGGTRITGVNITPSSGDIADGSDDEIVVIFTAEEVISADTSQTYYLKVTGVTSVDTVGQNIQVYMKDDAAWIASDDYTAVAVTAAKNFVWTDRSYPDNSHGESTADWTGGYLVENLVTDTYTLSR